MNKNHWQIVIASGVILILGAFLLFERFSLRALHGTKACMEIAGQKAVGYFNGQGNNRSLYSKNKNTCLLYNLYDDLSTGTFRIMVIDTVSDEIIFFFELMKGQEKDDLLGITKDQALDRVRDLGFVIF